MRVKMLKEILNDVSVLDDDKVYLLNDNIVISQLLPRADGEYIIKEARIYIPLERT